MLQHTRWALIRPGIAIQFFIFWDVLAASAARGNADIEDDQCLLSDDTKQHHSLLQSGMGSAAASQVSHSVEGSNKAYTFLETMMGKRRFISSGNRSSAKALGNQLCGTRALFPQLQFELELYRKLGLVKSKYSRCRVPSIRTVTQQLPMGGGITASGDVLYMAFDHVAHSKFHFKGGLTERRSLAAKSVAGAFCVVVLGSLVSFLASLRASHEHVADDQQAKRDGEVLHAAWCHGARRSLGLRMQWLEPVICHFGWSSALKTRTLQSIKEESPKDQLESYMVLRRGWQAEVLQHGLDKAVLMRAIWRYIGMPAVVWMLFTAAVAVALELAAMTVVLDMLLNYLHLARAARQSDPDISLDLLRPTMMFILLGFGTPMAARLFHNMTALCDAFHANRISAALLTMVYEKSQHLPYYIENDDRRREQGDLIQLITNDIRNSWPGTLTAYTNLVVQPICMFVLIAYLTQHLGRAAMFGVASTIWIGLVYIPIRNHVRTGQARWDQLANSRLNLMKEALQNVRNIKATVCDRPLSDRIYALREAELQTKFRFSLVQSLLDVPFNLFPFALVVSSLFFCCILYEQVEPGDIFVCMQVLSGLTYCSPALIRSLQKSLNVPSSIQRIERFLRKPEKGVCDEDIQGGGENRGNVRVKGSFSVADDRPAMLQDVDFIARRGELVAVVGEVASGKSAFLATVMGALPGTDASAIVEAPKNPIYCSQVPWVLDGTLQDNVTLGEPKDQDRLFDALDAASLLKNVMGSIQAPAKTQAQMRSTRKNGTVAETEEMPSFKFPYFKVWNFCAIFTWVFSVLNVDWKSTKPALGVLIAAIQGLLWWSVLEFPIQTVATLLTKTRKLAKAEAGDITIALNYNLLATSQADVDECMHNMLEAYVLNFHENVSSVLVSATNDLNLQQYELQVRNDHRAKIYKELFRSGLAWAGYAEGGECKEEHADRIWAKYEHLKKDDFVQNHLHKICERYAREYMVLHRTSRVLRKCGQYQDLILLSAGEPDAFTYTDGTLYGRAARKYGEPLFKDSEDCRAVLNRNFDYTLVLDSDTRVEAASVFRMLEIAAAYPEKAIVQPAIKMDCGPEDSIFMHLEAMRQRVYEPMNNTMTTLLGKSSFFGKGLIKNAMYAKYCLGTREDLIERVPIDVLSHDTFEAAVTNPLYCNSVYLLEAPCHNYITWDIRERRWNLGEMLLAGYFWPTGVGKPVRMMQQYMQGMKYNRIQVRLHTHLDKVSSYFAHSALRQMVLKPMLLAYIVVMHFVDMSFKWTPFCVVMFSIIIFPKFATMKRDNFKDVMLETGASILQFTPEAIVGTIRVLSAVKAHIAGAATWVPQRAVEEESKVSNPFVFSFRYLWYYSAFSLVWGLRIGLWATAVGPEAMFIVTILGTLFILPIYVGFTSFPANSLRVLQSASQRGVMEEEEAVEGGKQDSTDAALQALRVRLPKMRMRPTRQGSMPLLGPDPRKQEAALNVAQASHEVILGSRGSRLSEREQSLLSLARAAYSKKSNLVLLDDPFAMVDATTGKQILQNLIMGPLMRGRTRIVAMQPYVDYLEHFDRVVLLQQGKMVKQGTALEILATSEFQELMAKRASETSLESLQTTSKPTLMSPGESPLQLCGDQASATPLESQRPPEWDKIRGLIFSSGGTRRLIVTFLSVMLLRFAAQAQMILLGRWADQAMDLKKVGSTFYYSVMISVVVMVSVFQLLQGYSILSFSNNASSNIFKTSFSTLLKARIDQFWNQQPPARLLGRLSADLMNVDMALSHGCVAIASLLVDVAVQQIFCFIMMPPWLMFPSYIMVAAFCMLYWNTEVQLQMVSALALSRCQEEQSQNPASRLSVAAFQYQSRLVAQYCAHANVIVTSDSLSGHAKIWVVSRLTFCLCFQSTVCVLFGIMRPDKIGVYSLAVLTTSTFFIVQQLSNFVDCIGNVLSVCISLQRLVELSAAPQDHADQVSGDERVRNRLVQDGITVRIEGLRIEAFSGSGPDILSNITVDIPARTKTVFAGGTGCGKTTLLHAILRLVEPRSGRILFNGTDIASLGLVTLRSMIGLVPQVPTVFRGTIRFNIDPFGQYPDERIWAAIQCAQLLPMVRQHAKGLDHVITDSGSNLSVGQKQLLSLARAVCQQPPLLLLDEYCSALDPRTQEAVQDTIMLNFPNSTVISATRRMDEITNFNNIVVLERGALVRQGPVQRLLTENGSGSAATRKK